MNLKKLKSTKSSELRYFPSLLESALMIFFTFVVGVIVAAGFGADLSWVRYLPGRDFTGHIAIFGTLAFLWHGVALSGKHGARHDASWSSFERKPWNPASWPKSCWILALLVLAEEVSQIWWPNRTFSISDLVADAIGLGLGFTFSGLILGQNTADVRGPLPSCGKNP